MAGSQTLSPWERIMRKGVFVIVLPARKSKWSTILRIISDVAAICRVVVAVIGLY